MRTYEEAKKVFEEMARALSSKHAVSVISHEIWQDLTMDILEMRPPHPKQLLCMTTGEHGIEGFAGNFVLQELIEKDFFGLNLENTHVVLVHGMNPFGMAQKRKVNEQNVDLNRNFNEDFSQIEQNRGYRTYQQFFLPRKQKGPYGFCVFRFYLSLLGLLMKANRQEMKEATLLGQYEFETGFYYGGKTRTKSTQIMMDQFEKGVFGPYEKRIFIDIHTGFGPKYQMSIVHGPAEKRPKEMLQKAFDYPLIQNADGNDFYRISGDMINYLNEKINPDTDYATCFEFGTIGEGFLDQLKSLRIMLFENDVFHLHGPTEKIYQKVKEEFEALYMPDEEKWQQKVLMDFAQAMKGILKHYQMI